MKSIAIEPQSNNFIRDGGRIRYTKDELEHLALTVRHELSLFLGEWYMDSGKGLPYIPDGDSGKMSHRILLETAMRTKITSIAGIKQLRYFTPEFDKRQRLYRVSFSADTNYGELEESWEPNVGGNA
jgi:hypothetical protein